MLLEVLAVERPNDVEAALPLEPGLTPEERLMMRFYRDLDRHEQEFVRRAVQGLLAKRPTR